MTATALAPQRFVRRTQLGAHEYRKNFHQLDHDVIAAVTSVAADRVTPLMSKIYLRLASAPAEFWEREGVLYFAPRDGAGQPVKASKVLYEVLGVASATAHKALQWLHEQGIIGYYAGKNGVGIRIFLNRAASSIGVREQAAGKKILPFVRGSNDPSRGSTVEPAFNDSFADLEVSDQDINSRAPKNGADKGQVDKPTSEPIQPAAIGQLSTTKPHTTMLPPPEVIPVDEIIAKLKAELEPAMQIAAQKAATREHERMREWLENRGLPKAARVAQREAYNVLRQYGVIKETRQSSHRHYEVECSEHTQPVPRSLSSDELMELASCCMALLEVQGQAIERTLAEMSVAAGGLLLPEDVTRVRALTEKLLRGGAKP
jgi:hypothetical protein